MAVRARTGLCLHLLYRKSPRLQVPQADESRHLRQSPLYAETCIGKISLE